MPHPHRSKVLVHTIVETRFGSVLYGTSTPASDEDFKSVFLPDAEEILLQRIKTTLSNRRAKAESEKNVAGEEDRESFAFHRYLSLLAEGQTLALDMLFAPRWAMLNEPDPIWCELVANRHRVISRSAASFVGYCRTQAAKYGIKGSRVHAVREIVAWFDQAIDQHGHLTRLRDALEGLPEFIVDQKLEHTALIEIDHPGRAAGPVLHLECCDRKVPVTNTLKDCRAVFGRVFDQYGLRSLQAERQENIDWKALSHAVRVGNEAIELLTTGFITFPLPNAAHVLAIKRGERPYQEVGQEIEELLERVEASQLISGLRETADTAFMDELTIRAYHRAVCGS